MAFQIIFDNNSALRNAETFYQNRRIAVLFNVFCTLVTGLQDAGARLEQRLLAISRGDNSPANSVPLAVTDVWSILDTARRLLPILKGLGMSANDPALLRLFENVKEIRDSFQHLDERLADYYERQIIECSALGDFNWKYRPSLDIEERNYFCMSGIVKNDIESQNIPDAPATIISESIGVYDLSIIYVKRIVLDQKKKIYDYESVIVSIDQLIGAFNGVINIMQKRVSTDMEEVKRELNLKVLPAICIPSGLIMVTSSKKPS